MLTRSDLISIDYVIDFKHNERSDTAGFACFFLFFGFGFILRKLSHIFSVALSLISFKLGFEKSSSPLRFLFFKFFTLNQGKTGVLIALNLF